MMKNTDKIVRQQTYSQQIDYQLTDYQRTDSQQTIDNHNEKVLRLITEAKEYYDKNHLEQANCLYQQALKLDPENISAINSLGLIAMQAGMLSLAVEFFSMAYDLEPDNLVINKNIALAYTRMSQLDDAILHYNCILNIEKSNVDAHGELARLNLQKGNRDIALHHYKCAFKLNPDDAKNLQGITKLDASGLTEDDILSIEELLKNPDLSLEERCSFYFSLGNIYDAHGRYDEAFANYFVANISKGVNFNQDIHIDHISDIIATYSANLFERFSDAELNESHQPVFIVGMPCSGIKIVEQMLSMNSDIYDAGELNQINELSQKPGILTGNHFSIDSLNNASRYYLNEINNLSSNSGKIKPSRIINKLSENYLQLGLIALLFPNAHIIHCVRNPLDACLSSYFKNFQEDNIYSYDQKNIALYYQQYERLMLHWEKVLPIDIHKVDYEDLVEHPDASSMKLFEFIDIERQSSCHDIFIPKHALDTAGAAQEKANSYKASDKHWQNYKIYVHTMMEELTMLSSAAATARDARVL